MDNEKLSVETITRVYEFSADVLVPKYKECLEEYRKERRENIENLKNYVESFKKHNEKLEELIKSNLLSTCKKYKIDDKLWDKSLHYYISDENEEVLSLKDILIDSLKYFGYIFIIIKCLS
jgi:hypothetical protein